MANGSLGLFLASLMACAHAPSPSTAPAAGEPAPAPAPETPPPTVDPAAATPLDYFVGSWRCNGWLAPDDDTRDGVRIDVVRVPVAKPVYAIEYRWSVSTAKGPTCTIAWWATPDVVYFGAASGCRLGYRGEGGGWSADQLTLHVTEDPPQPKIPEDPTPTPPDVISSSDAPGTAQLRIARTGDAAFEMRFFPPDPVLCQRI